MSERIFFKVLANCKQLLLIGIQKSNKRKAQQKYKTTFSFTKKPFIMAIAIKRLSMKPLIQHSLSFNTLRSDSRRHFSASSVNQSGLEDGAGTSRGEYSKWQNGGGIFHESACVDPTATIEIGAIVHQKAVLGANVYVGSGAVVGPAVAVGSSTKIGYNVALSNCNIGDSCVIHNGVSIGQDGFGFFVDNLGKMVKKAQLLNARIGDHVEIGANTCIDRGSWRDTLIGDHSKIDNLVQIGHNVVIGNSCMLCGQVGIAGSVTSGLQLIAVSPRILKSPEITVASLLFQFMNGEDKLQIIAGFQGRDLIEMLETEIII